jgi:hypothetical protein
LFPWFKRMYEASGYISAELLPLFQNSITFSCRFRSIKYSTLCLKPTTLSNRAGYQLSKTGLRLFERAVVVRIWCCEHFADVTCREKPLRPCQQWNGRDFRRWNAGKAKARTGYCDRNEMGSNRLTQCHVQHRGRKCFGSRSPLTCGPAVWRGSVHGKQVGVTLPARTARRARCQT